MSCLTAVINSLFYLLFFTVKASNEAYDGRYKLAKRHGRYSITMSLLGIVLFVLIVVGVLTLLALHRSSSSSSHEHVDPSSFTTQEPHPHPHPHPRSDSSPVTEAATFNKPPITTAENNNNRFVLTFLSNILQAYRILFYFNKLLDGEYFT